MSRRITVLVIPVYEKPFFDTTEPSVAGLQKLVEYPCPATKARIPGRLQSYPFRRVDNSPGPKFVLYAHEEGYIRKFPENTNFPGVYGPCFVSAIDDDGYEIGIQAPDNCLIPERYMKIIHRMI